MKRICALAMLALLLGMLCAGGPAGVYADGAEAVSSVSAGSSADPLQTGTPFACLLYTSNSSSKTVCCTIRPPLVALNLP